MEMDEDNENIEDTFEIDPDYESTNTAIRRVASKEAEDHKLTEDKLRTIIQEEFDKELQIRQKQLEEIEEKVFKAQKLLHVVRYVLISSYFNSKTLEFDSTTASPFDPSNALMGQNRIHPAVKKLLGKNSNDLKFLAARTKRKATIFKTESNNAHAPTEPKKIKLEIDEQNVIMTGNTGKLEPSILKVIEEPITNRKKVQHRVVVGNISYFKKSLEQNNLTHKWMVYVKIFKGPKDGPEVTNAAVDKVVFYLHPSYKPHDVVDISQPPYHLSRRGWGEFPLRVKIYFKSPMNKPVDVIHQLKLDNTFTERQTLGNQTIVPIFLYDYSSQICKREPVDTSSSSSTSELRNEKLNNNNFTSIVNNIIDSSSTHPLFGDDEIISIEPIVKIEPSTSFEHDYCYDNITIKEEPIDEFVENEYEVSEEVLAEVLAAEILKKNLIEDHGYSLSSDKEGHHQSPKKHRTSPVKQAYNELIYGLGPHYLDPLRSRARTSVRPRVVDKINSGGSSPEKNAKSALKILKTVTGQSIRLLPESFNQVLLSNGNVVSVKLLKSPPTTTPTSGRSSSARENKGVVNLEAKLSNSTTTSSSIVKQEKYQLLKLPKRSFKSMGEVLPYLLKRLPLWNTQAVNADYKCTYPFAACSEEEYRSWNVGKKLAAEWSRAKTIKRIVSGEPYSKSWTTKTIFMYARSHLYTPPVLSYRLFEKESLEKRLILNCYQGGNNNCVRNGYSAAFTIHRSDETINITSPVKPVIDTFDSRSVDTCIDISDKRLSQECAFVKETALDVGVILRPEVLVKGVSMNASERIIFEAVKCFAENLIRRSRNCLISQNKYNDESSEITTYEVERVLEERREFQSIQTFKENKKTMDFFS